MSPPRRRVARGSGGGACPRRGHRVDWLCCDHLLLLGVAMLTLSRHSSDAQSTDIWPEEPVRLRLGWPTVLDIEEAKLLEEESMVPDEDVQPRAMDPGGCARQWAHTHMDSFGRCNRTVRAQPISRGEISELSFLVSLSVLKEDRLRPALKGLTNCTGFALDDDLVLTHAHCVGPRTEHEVTTRIWAYQPLVATGAPVAIEATRVCWSKRLWWPGAPRAPYDVALVRLARPLRRESAEPVCLASNGQPGNWRTTDQAETCALVQLCQRDNRIWPAERPYTNESHWFRVQPVASLSYDFGDYCRRKMAGAINGQGPEEMGPRLMSCFESSLEQHGGRQNLAAVCPLEFGRLVFCFRGGCPAREGAARLGPALVGFAPMDFHAGEPALYRAMSPTETSTKYRFSVADLGIIHEQLKDMLVDARVHTHGGSLRTICRQLATTTSSSGKQQEPGFVRDLRVVSNAGYKGSPVGTHPDNVDFVPPRVLSPGELPAGGIDAFDLAKCWQPKLCLLQNSAYPARLYGQMEDAMFASGLRLARLPFLLDLTVRKRIVTWQTANDPVTGPRGPSAGNVFHPHTCDAWLVSHDTAITHAECLGPETLFDRLESVELKFHHLGNEIRYATKACWPRESLPPRWHRGFELAVVRFAPSVNYTPHLLQPACLKPGLRFYQKPLCSILLQCPQADNGSSLLVTTKTRHCGTVLGPFRLTFRLDEDWAKKRYNSHHMRTYLGLHPRQNPCQALEGESDRSRLILCRTPCDEHPKHGCAYLAALGLGPIFDEHRGVRYTGFPRFETWPIYHDEFNMMLGLDLELARRQLMELLLASHADNEGTRDVSCQMVAPPPPKPAGRYGTPPSVEPVRRPRRPRRPRRYRAWRKDGWHTRQADPRRAPTDALENHDNCPDNHNVADGWWDDNFG